MLEARQQVGKQGALIRQQQAALRRQEAQLAEERQARARQSDELRALHAHVEHLQNQASHPSASPAGCRNFQAQVSAILRQHQAKERQAPAFTSNDNSSVCPEPTRILLKALIPHILDGPEMP